MKLAKNYQKKIGKRYKKYREISQKIVKNSKKR